MGRSRRGLKVFRCPEPQRETWLRVASDLVRRMSAEVETWSVKGTTGSHIIHILSLEALDFACKQLPGKRHGERHALVIFGYLWYEFIYM